MKILFFTILCFLFACSDSITEVDIPKKLLKKEEMINLIKELSLIESHFELNFPGDPKINKTITSSGNLILKKYNINRQDFEKNIDYYGANQALMQEINAAVLDSLNKMMGEINTSNLNEQKLNVPNKNISPF